MSLRSRSQNPLLQILGLFSLLVLSALASASTVVVSIPEQKLYVFDESGEKTTSYRVSTSAHGLGDKHGTYSTPLGKLVIANKIGANAQVGTIFKGGHRTGEICKINAPGRDPIVTRILHLRGLEKQNSGAYDRRIYIHGTPDERNIGKPVSYGCVRMRSRDVIDLFDRVSTGTLVEIVDEKVSKGLFAKTTWQTESPKGSAAPVPETKLAAAKISEQERPKIAFASKRALPKPASNEAKPAGKVDEAMTLLEMPGMSFKFGPSSSREVR